MNPKMLFNVVPNMEYMLWMDDAANVVQCCFDYHIFVVDMYNMNVNKR